MFAWYDSHYHTSLSIPVHFHFPKDIGVRHISFPFQTDLLFPPLLADSSSFVNGKVAITELPTSPGIFTSSAFFGLLLSRLLDIKGFTNAVDTPFPRALTYLMLRTCHLRFSHGGWVFFSFIALIWYNRAAIAKERYMLCVFFLVWVKVRHASWHLQSL